MCTWPPLAVLLLIACAPAGARAGAGQPDLLEGVGPVEGVRDARGAGEPGGEGQMDVLFR